MTPNRCPRLLVGTGNAHKLAEIRELLADLDLEVLDIDILPAGEEPEETGSTFIENARIKAIAFAERACALAPDERPRWVIADDSGLCVDALGGAPGVHSARYAGPDANSEDNCRKLLAALATTPDGERGAHFNCTLTCVRLPLGEDSAVEPLFDVVGECHGTIAHAPRGAGGFGYDPVFLDGESGRSFAELSASEKHSRSHRGEALRKFREELARRRQI